MNDGPPRDSDLNNDSDGEIKHSPRRYPDTPLHNGTAPKPLPIVEICMVSVVIAVIVAHLWTVWAMRADVNIMMVRQKETHQQIHHITKLVETMHQVRWRLVSDH